MSANTTVGLLAFENTETARDMLDQINELAPAFLEYYDGDFFTLAAASGKKYDFSKEFKGRLGAVLLVGFDDFSERVRTRKLRKLRKLAGKTDTYLTSAENEEVTTLMAVREVTAYSVAPAGKDASAPPLIDGAYVPRERF